MEREIRLEYLYNTYGKARFLNWCRSLSIFRFIKSHSYPDDLNPDRFIALISFLNTEELSDLIKIMKIKPQLDIEAILKMETVVSKKVTINDIPCFFEINQFLKNLVFIVSGTEKDQFDLDDSTFQRAKKIDDFLISLEIDFESSPYNDDYCITPEFYPNIWK